MCCEPTCRRSRREVRPQRAPRRPPADPVAEATCHCRRAAHSRADTRGAGRDYRPGPAEPSAGAARAAAAGRPNPQRRQRRPAKPPRERSRPRRLPHPRPRRSGTTVTSCTCGGPSATGRPWHSAPTPATSAAPSTRCASPCWSARSPSSRWAGSSSCRWSPARCDPRTRSPPWARSIRLGHRENGSDPTGPARSSAPRPSVFDDMLDAVEGAEDHALVSERRLRDFLSDAAHELRTPIAGVQAVSEHLLRADLRGPNVRRPCSLWCASPTAPQGWSTTCS